MKRRFQLIFEWVSRERGPLVDLAVPVLAAVALGCLFTTPAFARQTTSPHGELRAGLDCTTCHRTDSWRPLRDSLGFSHESDTAFPLFGSHGTAACVSCHVGLRFDFPRVDATECASCHADPHAAALGSDCARCHTETSFRSVDGTAIHSLTSFPLLGSHLSLACESCHTQSETAQFADADPACVSCHEADRATPTLIDHLAAGFPATCATCHGQDTWTGAVFDHATQAHGFALIGAHESAVCANCHGGPGGTLLFTPAGNDDCVTCHEDDRAMPTLIDHTASGFPATCGTCHGQDTWAGALFDHAAEADGFVLIGAHDAAVCASCHGGPAGSLLWEPANNDDCVTCHEADRSTPALIDHIAAGFPTTCATCHGQDTWTGAVFNHTTQANGFALVGAHEAAVCASCHGGPGGTLLFTPAGNDDCVTCHEADRSTPALIGHIAAGFPTTCATCHGQDTWTGAVFDHTTQANGFALVGAHEAAVCASCHGGPGGTLLFTPAGNDDCITCHKADYVAEHSGTGFPEACLTCHSQNDWQAGIFSLHDTAYFPVYSGEHRGEWNSCFDCHEGAPVQFVTFVCVNCHEHAKPDMDDEHREVAGYTYVSSECLRCHPEGRNRD